MAGSSFGFTRVTMSRDPYGPWSEWHKTTSLWPRRSITGKMIVGSMCKRGRTYHGRRGDLRDRQFAKDKELFEEKLKGNA